MTDIQPALLAKRLGVGLKALRLWEAEGLIKPHRLSNGWRVFRSEDIIATWRVAALRGLGFPLTAIRAMLNRGAPSFDTILAVQEKNLSDQLERLSRAKLAIAKARAEIATGHVLDADALIKLYQETNMSNLFTHPAIEALWETTYTPEQLAQLKARDYSPQDAEEDSMAWSTLIAEAEKLRVLGDPTSQEALDMGRRWFALVRKFTQGEPGLIKSSRAFYDNGYKSPETAKHMPFGQALWDFVGEVAAALIARGEDIT